MDARSITVDVFAKRSFTHCGLRSRPEPRACACRSGTTRLPRSRLILARSGHAQLEIKAVSGVLEWAILLVDHDDARLVAGQLVLLEVGEGHNYD
jgi:hypothetical protein